MNGQRVRGIGLVKGQSQLIDESLCDRVYTELKEQRRITGEFPSGTVGNTLHNFCTLSEERALNVKKYLVEHGVEASRIETRGFGATQPVDTNDTEEGRAKNRRVEFKVSH